MRGIRYFSFSAAFALSIAMMGAPAFAAPAPTFTYEGYLEDGGGPVGPGSAVNKNFVFEIWGQDSGGTCKLATQSLTLPVKDGNFSAEIGNGMTFPGGVAGLTAVFDLNNASIAGASSCAFDATDTSGRRYLQVYVEGHSMGQVDFTRAPIAMVAQTLQGYTPANLIRVNSGSQVTQSRVDQFYSVATSGPGSVYYDGSGFVSYDPHNGALLTAGSVGNAAISGLDWAKLTGIPANISQIAGLSCATGQYLKFSGSSWSCAAASVAETDPTVQLYAKNAPGTGLIVNGSNQIIPDFGTGSGKVVQGNDPRLSDSRSPNGAASGDLSGTYPSPTVAKLQGRSVATSTPLDGQILRYNNSTTQWEPYNFGIGDLKTSAGASQFISASCASSQTLTWSSVTNTFSCTNISLPVAQLSGTLPISQGGTGQTTALNALNALLPAQSGQNGKYLQTDGSVATWATPSLAETDPKVGTNTTNYLSKWNGSALVASGLIESSGNFGIGTATPAAKLDVNGTINATAMTINGVPVGTSTGMTSLNGSSEASQTFANGTGGLTPAFNTNSGTGVHTLNIPMANTASVNAGLISKAEYDAFNSKLGPSTAFSGDVSGTSSTISVDKIKGVAVSATAPTSGQSLVYNGTNWVPGGVDASQISGTISIANGGTGQTTANAAFNALAPLQTSMSGKFLTTNGTNTSWATALTSESDPKIGANTTNALPKWNGTALVTSSIYDSSGKIGIGSSSPSTSLDVGAHNDAIAVPKGTTAQRPASPSNGFVRYNTDLKGFEAYVNGGWQQLVSGTSPTPSEDGKSLRWNDSTKQFEWFTSGVSSLNASTVATQSFMAPGNSGTSPNWSTNAALGQHTLNIPMASGTGVTAGLITKSEYDAFNNKLGAVSNTASLANGKIWIGDGSGKAQELAVGGDISLTNAGVSNVNRIRGTSVSGSPSMTGQVLRYDGANYTPNFVAITDLRSTVTGTNAFPSSCASNQTLTYNSVGDSMGCASISLPVGQLTGTLPVSSGGTGASTQQGAANAVLPSQSGANGKYLQSDGTNVSWATVAAGGGILNATQNAQLNSYYLSGDGGNEGLKIDSAGNIGSSGTVGIGTISPSLSFKLDVNGTSIMRDDVTVLKGGGSTMLLRNTATPGASNVLVGKLDFSTDSYTTASISGYSSEAHGTYRGTNLRFSTVPNGSTALAEQMRVENNGSVGIGTVNPIRSLHVASKTGSATGGTFVLEHTDAGVDAKRRYISSLNGTMEFGRFSDATTPVGTPHVIIDSTGKVGIGNMSPGYVLDIADNNTSVSAVRIYNSDTTGNKQSSFFAQNSAGLTTVLHAFGTTGQVGTSTSHDFFVVSSGLPRITVKAGGNVGIGTTTPQTTLDINGAMRLAKNSSAPFSCSATVDTALAVTSVYTMCICKGSSSTWVKVSDGTTLCSW